MTIHIRICPSDGTHCTHCKTVIRRGTLRVSGTLNRKYVPYFHLDCFQPSERTPVLAEDVDFGDIKDEHDFEQVKKWAETWNTQFDGAFQWTAPMSIPENPGNNCEEPLRTLLSCVLPFTSLSDLELSVAFTCKQWFYASRDSLYWQSLLIRDFNYQKPSSDYRKKYISYKRTTCWRCKQLLHLEDIEYQCPLYRRPLCKGCARAEDCRVVSLSSLFEHKNVHPSTIRALSLPTFLYYGQESIYMRTVTDVLLPYAEKRRTKLINVLDKAGEMGIEVAKMQAVDLSSYYRPKFAPCCYEVYLLTRFCGKHKAFESSTKTAQEVIRKLKSVKRFQ